LRLISRKENKGAKIAKKTFAALLPYAPLRENKKATAIEVK
jgi:hypothetical protein